MRKRSRGSAGGLAILVIAALALGGLSQDVPEDDNPPAPPPSTCSDGVDNDGDGLTDALDPECDPMHPAYDDDETGDA